MKIFKNTEGCFILSWTYSIRNNVKIQNDKEYLFYTSVIPAPLVEYLGKEYIYLYQNLGKTFVTNVEPPYAKQIKIKLLKQGNPQQGRKFTISKKFFPLEGRVDKSVEFWFHLDKYDDLSGERGLIELRII